MFVRLLLLADTHVRDGSTRDLPASAWELARGVDGILHAGDVTGRDFLTKLVLVAPTSAVLGNNDQALVDLLPERRIVEVDGVSIGMVHDSGGRIGRAARLHRWFPSCDAVVFGHSHEPCDEIGLDGQLLLNPGSAVERRRQAHHTVGLLEVGGGAIVEHEIRVVR